MDRDPCGGLADGRAATILHLSHAVADGVGTVEMFANIYNLERDTPIGELAPLPIPQDLSANELMKMGINRLPSRSPTVCWASSAVRCTR